MKAIQIFSRLTPLPENRLALLAAQRVAACLGSRRHTRQVNPVFLHGPAGTGKSHLVRAISHEANRHVPELAVAALSAADLASDATPPADFLNGDLLIIEDLQHLARRNVEMVVQWFDALQARHQQMLFTASVGPGQLDLPARLTSRLASGLVIALQPLGATSRFALLQDLAQRRQFAIARDVLTWLADHLTGGARQLDGALARLQTLTKLRPAPLDLATVAGHFREDSDAARPTVERIAQRVSTYFQVEPRQLQSRRRYRSLQLPRQVSMYLARTLTDLSFDEIGTYFGGRDHSTVLHACRKVEQSLASDAVFSGTVKRLQADLA